jgi:nitrite reductase/ring-hydroxylating ferredoxin subunit
MRPMRAGAPHAEAGSRRRAPACPQNWYLLAHSAELKPGAILARPLGEIEIVLYRGRDSGQSIAFAAHCAHAGCHLRHGRVVGDNLQCALHHRVIGPDGRFIARDGSLLASTPQLCLPVAERFGGIFVFAGAQAVFAPPTPVICARGPVTTRALPPQSFPLPWSTLISNGMDIDHLQAVHDRRLCAPPDFQEIGASSVRVSYRAGVTGSHVSDRVMKWISGNDIRTTITCVGGSMMMVESTVGSRASFVILSMCPLGKTGTEIRAIAGVPGAARHLSAGIAAWLFHAFLEKDVGILAQMEWHEPDQRMTLGDTLMCRLAAFFRSLPEFVPTARPSAVPDQVASAPLMAAASRSA